MLKIRPLAVLIAEKLLTADKWIVLAHEKPDGDTLGSSGALAHAGRRMGKQVFWGGRDPIPPHYSFLDSENRYAILDEQDDLFSEDKNTVVICCDISTKSRAHPTLFWDKNRPEIINIDHHSDNELFGDINWIDGSASATAEMVTELLLALDSDISTIEANQLYTALVSDNGGFRFSSTSVQSHEVAIALLKSGASPSVVTRHLEQRMKLSGMHLWSVALSRVEIFGDGVCAMTYLSEEDFRAVGAHSSENDGLVNELLLLKGVSLVALCTAQGDEVRVSLRSYPPYSARDVAHVFLGGGHALAAGCKITLPLDDALLNLRKEMEKHVGSLSATS